MKPTYLIPRGARGLMVTLETLLVTDDVTWRYVWDWQDIYTRVEGSVKVCLRLVNGNDRIYSVPV